MNNKSTVTSFTSLNVIVNETTSRLLQVHFNATNDMKKQEYE